MIELAIASGAGGLIGMSLGLVVAKNRLKDDEKDEIPETVECPGCSRRIERGAFCRHCGEYLSWEDQADEPAGVDVDEKDDESLSILGRVAARIPVEIEVEDSEDETETTETETTETESIGEETETETGKTPTTDGGGNNDPGTRVEEILGDEDADRFEEIVEALEDDSDDSDDETETTETESIGEETPEDKDYVEIDVEEDLDDGRTVYRGEIS
jgi:hypothetical protein